jgi:hypothetical protein
MHVFDENFPSAILLLFKTGGCWTIEIYKNLKKDKSIIIIYSKKRFVKRNGCVIAKLWLLSGHIIQGQSPQRMV